jgi:hypothetical protein
VPQPAWSGANVDLPEPPFLPSMRMADAYEAYSVYGAVHQLRSLTHFKEVTAGPISVVGYVVDSNIPRAPACAVHRTGKADPANCESPLPSFWIADDKTSPTAPRIRVVGWARNFAVIFDAMTEYKRSRRARHRANR